MTFTKVIQSLMYCQAQFTLDLSLNQTLKVAKQDSGLTHPFMLPLDRNSRVLRQLTSSDTANATLRVSCRVAKRLNL